jgi:Tfp pilus assembly protein PilW
MRLPLPRALVSDQRGFTLIETLVAMVSGLVVMGALFAILEVSLHQSTRQADLAQATQLGRIAMTKVVDELHSTCLSSEFRPVQEKSTASKLIFVNAYSKEAEITGAATRAAGARKDEILWEETAAKQGKLIDKTYLSTAGSAPSFTFAGPSPSYTTVIAEKIMHAEEGGKEVPFFRYYQYAEKASTGTSTESTTLTEFTPAAAGMVEAEAKKAASVQVSFRTLPPDGLSSLGRRLDLSSQVTFAFSAPASESKVEATPCE